MSLKNAVSYRYKNKLLYFCLYYVMIILVQVGKIIAMKKYNDTAGRGEVIIASAVFLFIIGLLSYKSDLKMFVQNGLSREKSFLSFLAFVPVALIQAVIDTLIYRVQISTVGHYLPKQQPYMENILEDWCYDDNIAKIPLLNKMAYLFFTIMILYLACIIFGYMLTSILYRLSAKQKVAFFVTAGGLYIITSLLLSEGIFDEIKLFRFFDCFFFGNKAFLEGYWHLITALIVIIGCFLSVSALVCRKAEVRK